MCAPQLFSLVLYLVVSLVFSIVLSLVFSIVFSQVFSFCVLSCALSCVCECAQSIKSYGVQSVLLRVLSGCVEAWNQLLQTVHIAVDLKMEL